MRLRPLLPLVVTAFAVIGLTLPATSYAESVHHHDPAHDVQLFDSTGTSTTDAPTNKDADIVAADFAHTRRRVTADVRLRAIADSYLFGVVIQTPSRRLTVLQSHTKGNPDQAELLNPHGHAVDCSGLHVKLDTDASTITVKVPDNCLHKPSWVRLGAAILVPDTSSGGAFVDDALRNHRASESNVALTARLRHG